MGIRQRCRHPAQVDVQTPTGNLMTVKPAAITNWWRYQYRKIFRPRTVTNGGLKIHLGDQAKSSYARSIYRDTHEAEERAIVLRNLWNPTTPSSECGAGIGVVTTLCCQQIGSDRVHAYEANTKLEPVLRQTFALNHVSPHLEMKMVSLDGGVQDFFAADRFVVSSRYDNSGQYDRGNSKARLGLDPNTHRRPATFVL